MSAPDATATPSAASDAAPQTTGPQLLAVLFEALTETEQEEAFARIRQVRLDRQAQTGTAMAGFIASMAAVTAHVGHVPAVDEYKQASAELRAAGHDVETFNRVYKHFGSWPRAKEALTLSETTTPVGVEARFRYRKLGKVWRFTDDNLRDAMTKCFEHYGHVPTVAEYEFWRGRELELARASGDEGLMLPSTNPFRRRWKTWEAALLHFGFTPDQVAERLATTNAPRDANPDGHAPPWLPMAELAPVLGHAVAGMGGDAVQRLVAAYRALPQRSRYVLTARYGLAGGDGDGDGIGAGAGHGKGGAVASAGPVTLTLKACAEPLGLHLDRVRQLQLVAVETLAEATFETPVSDAEQRESVLRALRELAVDSTTRAAGAV